MRITVPIWTFIGCAHCHPIVANIPKFSSCRPRCFFLLRKVKWFCRDCSINAVNFSIIQTTLCGRSICLLGISSHTALLEACLATVLFFQLYKLLIKILILCSNWNFCIMDRIFIYLCWFDSLLNTGVILGLRQIDLKICQLLFDERHSCSENFPFFNRS